MQATHDHMANTDTSYEGYKTSLSPINKLLSIVAMVMLLLGGKYVVTEYSWWQLLPYIGLWFVFCNFLGTPALVNVLRCAASYRGRAVHLFMTLLLQLVNVVLMGFALELAEIPQLFSYLLVLGVIQAFAMPKAQLLQERKEAGSTPN
jgi:hypothetical protein